MKKPNWPAAIVLAFAGLLLAATLNIAGQPEPQKDPKQADPKKDFDPKKGPGFGMAGGPFGQQRKLVKQFDKDGKDAKHRKDGDPKVLKVAPAFAVFGIGNVLANNIVKRADADKDGKITLDELLKATETLFKEGDKNKDGKLDEAELGSAIAE